MNHVTSGGSPDTNTTKETKRSFLTPCRRLGLARKSPAAGGTWHTVKVSPIVSNNEPSSDFLSPASSKAVNSPITAEKTPTRRVKIAKQPFSKRLKSAHTSENSHSLQVQEKQSHTKELQNCPSKLLEQTEEDCLKQSKDSSENLDFKNEPQISETNPQINHSEVNVDVSVPENVTEDMLTEVKIRIKKKEEKLKDLKLAQLYKKKHDLGTLQQLTEKWREGCQTALNELLSLLQMQGHKLDLLQLLQQLRIPPELVKYRYDLEDFE